MQAFRKVQQGAPLDIPAATWNALLDNMATNQGFVAAPAGIEGARNVVLIKNICGHDVERFHVLGISGVAVEPTAGAAGKINEFARRPILTGVTPAEEHADKFVVMLEPARNEAVGLAAIGGVFACRVDLKNGNHKFAQAKVGDRTQLQSSATCGAIRLVWVEGQPTGPFGPTAPAGENKWAVGVM